MKMLKRLDPNPAEKIKNKFHDHPLLMTCQKAFHHYMADMEQFDFTSENLFLESAIVIDSIFDDPESAPQYLSSLWDSLKIRLKRNAQTTPPQQDLNIVCAVLFYVVAATFSLHWQEYYNTKIVDYLYNIVEKNGIFSDTQEQRAIINNLCQHAEELSDWINNYENTDTWLSDEIADTLEVKNGTTIEHDFKPSGITFSKTSLLTDRLIDIIGQRLAKANKLDASPDDFRKLFSGVNQQFTMTWLGTGGELRDLFKMLTDDGYVKPKRGYQQILKSHFLDEEGHRFNNIHGDKSIDSFQTIIDDCAFFLQHLIDNMTEIMMRLISENQDYLSEVGYFDQVQSAKQSGLSIRNKLR